MRLFRTIVLSLFVALLLSAPAGAQYFGKNKVQYREFDWAVIKTEHFEVYYYETGKQVALDAARMAERSYRQLSKRLGYKMVRPIPLILYASHSDFQQTNVSQGLISEGTGGVTEFIKRRVFLPFTGSYAELEHVLTHELVHAFQVEILWGSSGSVLANTLGFSPPLWFMEGMAEYLSVGEVDVHTRMWLRDAALQGYLIPIPILSRVGDIRVYRFGQSIFQFLADQYGDEKVGEILRAAPRVGGVNHAFQSVLGVSLSKFSEEWLEDVRRTYLPQIADYQKPEKFARKITDNGKDLSSLNLVPAVSPSGEQVCFISDRSMYSDIYLASTSDGKIKKKLIEGERTADFESLRFFSTSISWSPDERFIAFPAKIGANDAIYIVDVRTKKVRRKLKFDFDGVVSPSWSPDGEHLVFVALEGGKTNLFTCRTDGSELTRLTDDRFTCRDPAWSPDGRTIAFTTDRGGETDFEILRFGDFKIATYDLASGAIEILPEMKGKNIAPQWGPDGENIIFISDRSGISNLYDYEVATGRIFKLTNILTGITGIVPQSPPFSWSRSGEMLVFSAFSGGGWDLYTIRDPLRLKNVPIEGGDSDPALVAGTQLPEADEASEVGDEGPEPVRSTLPSKLVDLRTIFPKAEVPDEEVLTASADPNAQYALPDTTEFERKDYKLKFSQDFLFGGAGFASNVGFAGQSTLSFSDIMGNHNIRLAAGIYGSLSDADLFLSYANLKQRLNYAVSIFQFRNDFFIFSATDDAEFQSQIYRGAEFQTAYPLSKFRRFEVGARALSISSRVFQQSFDVNTGGTRTSIENGDTRYFGQPFVAMVFDNVLYGPTGPINGSRSRYSIDYAAGDVSYVTGIADIRNYWNIRHRYHFATRLIVGGSRGRDNQFFRVGGPFTFRGLDWGDLRGTRLGTLNLEFRYPFIDQIRFGWPLPLDIRSIGGILFVDGTAVWDGDGQELKPIYRIQPESNGLITNGYGFAYGFGARVNLGFFVLRWDTGRLTDFQRNYGNAFSFFTLAADF